MYAGIYRAKAVSVTTGQTPTLTAYVPQVFGDTPVIITDFLGTPEAGMGWVLFQNGDPEFPVWASGLTGGGGGGGGGGDGEGANEVWIGSGPPTDPEIELWYDPDAVSPGPGPSGSYVHNQVTPSTTWVIPHNLGFFPSVTVEDSAGNDIEGDVTHNSANQMTLTFSAAFAGKAYLS